MISKRLKVIAEMVDTNSIVDVGCDHALLDIYLAKTRNIRCIAIDIRENIINNVLKNVQEEKLEDKIKVKLNDGLDDVDIKTDDTVILSGLGTNTILNVVGDRKISNLIIQSNDDLYLLRKQLIKNGYYIDEEKIVLDGKYYIIIKFKLGKRKYKYNELLFGPELLKEKSSTLKDYLYSKKQYYEGMVKCVPDRYFIRKIKLFYYLYNIKKALDR